MGLIHLPFLTIHIPCRDYPDKATSDGKDNKEHPARVRAPKGIKPVFLPGMPDVVRNHHRQIEEYLFGLRRRNMMFLPVLVGIVLVPFEAATSLQDVKNIRHACSI